MLKVDPISGSRSGAASVMFLAHVLVEKNRARERKVKGVSIIRV